MKKTFKTLLSLVLAVVTAFSVCTVGFAAETADEVTGFTDEDFLTTRGRSLVN